MLVGYHEDTLVLERMSLQGFESDGTFFILKSLEELRRQLSSMKKKEDNFEKFRVEAEEEKGKQ